MEKENGTVTDWNEEKGFGFITPGAGGESLFFHINDYSRRHRRPLVNLQVEYFLSFDPQSRVCAVEVVPLQGHRSTGRALRQRFFSLALVSVFFLLLYYACITRMIPLAAAGLYLIMSVVAFMLYAGDKKAAGTGTWRTPEKTLHLVSLLGGWPGAAIAQSFLRHKSKKVAFRIKYWLTVAINCAVLLWLMTDEGSRWLRSLPIPF